MAAGSILDAALANMNEYGLIVVSVPTLPHPPKGSLALPTHHGSKTRLVVLSAHTTFPTPPTAPSFK